MTATNRGPFADLAAWYWDVPYVGGRYPGRVRRGELRSGGNCQLWAYKVLAFFGFVIGNLRSDDLWYDNDFTVRVDTPEPLDLVLYNRDERPYGAHVGLWTGDGVAHLCKEVGRPVVWPETEFARRERYKIRVGCKRPIALVRGDPVHGDGPGETGK